MFCPGISQGETMKKVLMILSMLLFFVSPAHAVSVSISPAVINTVDTGSSFKVEVWVKGVTNIGSFQFDLIFDPDVSDTYAGSVVFGNFIESTGRKTFFKLADDEIPGRLTCTVMTEGPPAQGPNGDGILTTVTLQRQNLSNAFLNLENVHITDTGGTEIPVTVAGAEIKPRYHIYPSVKAGSGSVTVSASSDVSVEANGNALVKPGKSASFTVQPAGCWYTADVKVDGVSKSPPYTIPNVSANHTIDAYFGIYQYIVNICAATGGSISPVGSATVNCGSSQKFTITPNKGYRIKDVIADAVSRGRISEYTFPSITSSGHRICAEFYPVPMGDIDGNDVVDLADAILALKILCGIDIGDQKIFIDADVNGDGKIGIEEVVYILQKIAEL